MKFYKKPEFLLCYYIFLVIVSVLILIFLILNYEEKDLIEDSTTVYDGVDDYGQVQPVPIEKDDDVIEAEEELFVERNIVVLDDGTVVVSAYLKGADDLILQDFVEEIKFNQHVELLESSVEAKNGFLFPASNSLEMAVYGPGPVSEKNSKFIVAILDINFYEDSDNFELYELSFKLDSPVDSIIFSGAEFRSGKYILELDEYEYNF